MKNTIPERVAHFLKKFRPFDLVSQSDLLAIAKEVRISYMEKGVVIYDSTHDLHDYFYVIHKGAVSLRKDFEGENEIIDHYDEGDIFGLRPLFAKEKYAFSAITQEESILYKIPIDVFRPIAENDKEVGIYLMENFASNTENPYTKEHQEAFFADLKMKSEPTDEMFELQPVNYVKNVVKASPESTIQSIAKLMTQKKVGSILLAKDDIPVGIITNKDLRNKVATGLHQVTEKAKNIMSSPVLCYPRNLTIAQAQTTMIKHNISHLCITEDGTPNTKIIGLASEEDIIVMQGNNPSSLMKAILRSNSTKELKRIRGKIMLLLEGYIMQNLPLSHTSKIIFELNDATIKRIINRCLEKMGDQPTVAFAWMSLGSQGRKEQLLHTDQDNAIVFENVPENQLETTRNYFLKIAKKVTKRLNEVGFDFCKADMMARNPRWCLSLDEWKTQFSKWTNETGNEELLLANIFFDFDISYGDSSLTNSLSDYVFEITKNNHIFLNKMAANAVRSASPLGFFRQFLLEKDGEHKDQFDLKARALMPLIDAGRLLALSHQIKNTNNTSERFERLAQLEPEQSDLFLSCSYAFKALLKFRTKHGLINNDSGRFIEVNSMMKEEKMKLKRCFKTISNIQEIIKLRYNVKTLIG